MSDKNSYLRLKKAITELIPSCQMKAYTLPELETVQKALNLSANLLEWYQTGVPETTCYLPWYGNDLGIFSPNQLFELQEGYRWISGDPSNLIEDWRTEWVVIGSIGGDPIITLVNEPGTPVLMDLHGQGYWRPKRISNSPGNFIHALAIWLELVRQYDGRRSSFINEDSLLRPEFLKELKQRLEAVDDPLAFLLLVER